MLSCTLMCYPLFFEVGKISSSPRRSKFVDKILSRRGGSKIGAYIRYAALSLNIRPPRLGFGNLLLHLGGPLLAPAKRTTLDNNDHNATDYPRESYVFLKSLEQAPWQSLYKCPECQGGPPKAYKRGMEVKGTRTYACSLLACLVTEGKARACGATTADAANIEPMISVAISLNIYPCLLTSRACSCLIMVPLLDSRDLIMHQ